MFTSHGFPFYRLFNVTVCGGTDTISHCVNNVTKSGDEEVTAMHYFLQVIFYLPSLLLYSCKMATVKTRSSPPPLNNPPQSSPLLRMIPLD